jgi:prepilin-type N-terminal cleavage/methylation domain-containing protein
MTPRPPAGFTLIEITVALVVGGMALTAAAALLQGLGGRAEAIRAAATRVDRDANAERLLRSVWANLRFSGDSTATIRGDSATVAFHAWCQTPEGWMRPCRGHLAVETDDAGYLIQLYMEEPQLRPLTLWRGLPTAGVRYLKDPAHGGTWQRGWSEIVIPAAIDVVAGADTLILAAW